MLCPSLVLADIVTQGSIAPAYNGTDDPWLFTVDLAVNGYLGIDGGSQVSNYYHDTYVGSSYSSSSTGSIRVSDYLSRLSTRSMHIGYYSHDTTLDVLNGARVTASKTSYIGEKIGSSGTVNVSGSHSKWLINEELYVGNVGDGTLNVGDGGEVTCTWGYLGYETGAVGSTTVSGPNSALTLTDNLYMGYNGEGTLRIENGGSVSNYIGNIASQEGSSAHVTVTGADSTWVNDHHLYVGLSGTATLDIEDGGSVSNTWGFMGYSAGASGSVSVTGPGSSWSSSIETRVGVHGHGSLFIGNGGQVNDPAGYVGYDTGSTGTATVSGAGSLWQTTSALSIGYFGSGELVIEDGGTVSSGYGSVGLSPEASGLVTITGEGSTWINNGVNLGRHLDSIGEVRVENGGAFVTGKSYLGYEVGGVGIVTVAGPGSSWTNAGALNLANSGNATINIFDGAEVRVEGLMTMTTNAEALCQVNLQGGTLDMNGHDIVVGSGLANFVFTDGVFKHAGSIGFDLDQAGGTLAPGGSIGQTEIIGEYTLSAGTVEIELGGEGDTHDVLTATGDIDIALLGTTLDLPGIGPMSAGTYTVIETTGGILNGMFEHVIGIGMYDGLVDVSYTSNAVTVTLNWDYLPGDLNGDGFVGLADLDVILSSWNQPVAPGDLSVGDVTGDGFVGLGDLDVVLTHWNAGTPPQVTAQIPEPGTAVGLLGLGLPGVIRRRRRSFLR